MYCVYKDKVCLMVWHIKRAQWVYIPEKKWYKMSDRQKRKYDLTI